MWTNLQSAILPSYPRRDLYTDCEDAQDGSGAANSAKETPDADVDGAATAAERPSVPEPADVGTDKTLEGVVQVRAAQQNPLILPVEWSMGQKHLV